MVGHCAILEELCYIWNTVQPKWASCYIVLHKGTFCYICATLCSLSGHRVTLCYIRGHCVDRVHYVLQTLMNASRIYVDRTVITLPATSRAVVIPAIHYRMMTCPA